MYHCKIARTNAEFQAIAKLNYETFVEEIPQHPPNEERMLVDKFHEENTYIVLYKDRELVGMLAFRDQRPFSIDLKIGNVESYLPAEVCKKMCEVRLLAIKKEFRAGRVFLRLAQALYAYVLGRNYSACVISGVTSQEHLYKHIGFTQFAEAVGDANARFLPMVLTSEDGHSFYHQFQKKHAIFFPGPVQQFESLNYTTVSHRSDMFGRLHHQLCHNLKELANVSNIALVNGSGTVANDMMFNQLKQRFWDKKGVICSNGEFGERLIQQAMAIGLNFEVYEQPWGHVFEKDRLEQMLADAKWCAFVHGETSMGMLNDLQMFIELKQCLHFTLAVDCISSFGAVPFSLNGVDLATATSGKALGALAGLSFIFYKGELASGGPKYLDLMQYEDKIPYTLPAYLIANVLQAIQAYPKRYETLQKRMACVLQLMNIEIIDVQHYPTAITFKASETFIMDALLNGIELHAMSPYLTTNHIAQISTVQPTFDKDFGTLIKWLNAYQTIHDTYSI